MTQGLITASGLFFRHGLLFVCRKDDQRMRAANPAGESLTGPARFAPERVAASR
jgi:hypothetical protein